MECFAFLVSLSMNLLFLRIPILLYIFLSDAFIVRYEMIVEFFPVFKQVVL